MSTLSNYLLPAAFVAFPHIGGFAGGLASRGQIATWYAKLKKAPWNPPNWAFGPVWFCLYTCMGYASWLIYMQTGRLDNTAMYLYAAQLAVNWSYSPMFFNAHLVGLAFFNILANIGLVVACIIEFRTISPLASYLMLPYLAWLCLASTLNLYIWIYNDLQRIRDGNFESEKKKPIESA